MNQSEQFWKYTQKPYGSYPVQAEGTLKSGEKFYFRLRWGYASLTLSGMRSKHGLDDPIWKSSVEHKPTWKGKDYDPDEPPEEEISEIIEGLVMDYVLSVEGKEFDENEVVDLATWRRRQYIKQRLEKK